MVGTLHHLLWGDRSTQVDERRGQRWTCRVGGWGVTWLVSLPSPRLQLNPMATALQEHRHQARQRCPEEMDGCRSCRGEIYLSLPPSPALYLLHSPGQR